MINISPADLSEAALLGVIDDFVLREGTDYGDGTASLQRKRDAVLAQLEAGTVRIWFDPASESVTLRLASED
jgi:uncharacterized protein YheU (UPF0270 family)